MHSWTSLYFVLFVCVVLLLVRIAVLLSQVAQKLQTLYLLLLAVADAHFETATDNGAAWLRRYRQYFG